MVGMAKKERIEVEGKVMIAGNGRTKISINGFREVYECGTGVVKYDNGKTFKVCTLPGIAILKLIAYDDRPEIRQKDIQDLSLILKHYFELETEIIYDLHHDLFDDTSENKLIAARVLGRQMKLILKRSSELERRIVGVLKAEIENPEKSKIAELMVVGTENTIYDAIDLMKELLRGIEEF